MTIADDLNFDEWFEIFLSTTQKLGYSGPVDKYTFEADFDEGKTPESSAKDFVDEMNS